ncbi:MAG TPA: FHA domain-containing protein [Rhodocyclaceae bacterium]|nr:FHA domain-containing protein [Rhodocyclaceae bacterium]
MAKLILSMDGLVLKDIPITKERVTIGRKPHNDIQIDNLAISGEHAAIITLINDSFLEDLNSTNGTFVNGQPVKKHFLQNGDVIELGKYGLKYLSEAAQQTAAADFEKTMVLRPDMMRRAVEQATPQPAADQPPPQAQQQPTTAMVRVLNGGNAGRELELTKTLTTLGKPHVQVAVIARRPQGYFITHVEGANLPVVSGQTLEANRPHALSDHDIIDIGGVKMEFLFKA